MEWILDTPRPPHQPNPTVTPPNHPSLPLEKACTRACT